MKGRLLAISTSLLLLVFFSASCKKEASPGIIGSWVSEAIYQPDTNGSMTWTYSLRIPYFINFKGTGRFDVHTDVPTGTGTYHYDRHSGKITMTYDPSDTNPAGWNDVIEVEQLTSDKLVIGRFFGPDSRMQMIKY